MKPGASLVLGETDPELVPVFLAEQPGEAFFRDVDFACNDNMLAVGGRLLEIRTPGASYPELFLPLHGAHQGDNAAAALAAVETFFGGPLSPELITIGFENVVMPGRFEIVDRHPSWCSTEPTTPPAPTWPQRWSTRSSPRSLSASTSSDCCADATQWRCSRRSTRSRARLVIATAPSTPRAIPAREVARAAISLDIDVVVVEDVARGGRPRSRRGTAR